jgi:O-antigen ligase
MFGAAAFLSLLLGINQVNPLQALTGSLYLVRWAALTGVYFYLLKYRKAFSNISLFKRKYSLSEALLISGLVFSSFGLLQYLIFPDLRELKWLGWDDHYYRLTGTLLDPGFTGIILALTTLLALGIKLQPKLKILSVTLPTAALLLTYSRASYIAFLVGLVVFALMGKKLKKGLVAVLIFLAVLFLLPQAESEGTNLLRVYSLFQRMETWQQGILIIRNNPVFGVGFNLLRYAKLRYGLLGEDWQTSHSASGLDNSYLFVLATTGVVGFIFCLNLFYRLVKIIVKNKKAQTGISTSTLASLSAVAVHAIFNNTLFYPWVIIWIWYLIGSLEPAKLKRKAYSS